MRENRLRDEEVRAHLRRLVAARPRKVRGAAKVGLLETHDLLAELVAQRGAVQPRVGVEAAVPPAVQKCEQHAPEPQRAAPHLQHGVRVAETSHK